MRRRSSQSSSKGTVATIVVDGNTLNIVHVYVHCTMRQAMRVFLQSLSHEIDPMYSDAREHLQQALQRYQFIETHQVSIRRS